MKIGSNIRKIRKSLELSQEAVIRNCKIKISQATLSKIENDLIEIDAGSERLMDIATSMGILPEIIIQFDQPIETQPVADSSENLASNSLQIIIDQLQMIQNRQQQLFEMAHEILTNQKILANNLLVYEGQY